MAPWDGSQNYQYPPGTPGVPDTPIESTDYNAFINDLVNNDLNVARPIHRGGTAATTADGARANLSAEAANQVVTNYDTQAWQSGSFSSAAGATSAPAGGQRFVGFVTVQDANNITLIAYGLDSTPIGVWYQRVKKDGVWGSWSTLNTFLDGSYVNVTGDTMTGDLAIAKAAPTFSLNTTAAPATGSFHSRAGGNLRWTLFLGDGGAEGAGNQGSDFRLRRYSNAGAFLNDPLVIIRDTGTYYMSSDIFNIGNGAAGNALGPALALYGGDQVGGGSIHTYYRGATLNFAVGHESKIFANNSSNWIIWSSQVGIALSVNFNTGVVSLPFGATFNNNLVGIAGAILPTPLAAGGMATATTSLGKLEVQASAGAHAAFMSFHRIGAWAEYFGLDTDNFWKVGGWSAGATARKIFHEGFMPRLAVNGAVSGFTLAETHCARLIDLSGTFTVSITAAATLGSGWSTKLRNSGTGVVTLDPNSTETINGLTTFKIYPTESVELICNGANFHAVAKSGRVLMETQTGNGSITTMDFTRVENGRFSGYEFELTDITPATGTGPALLLRVSSDGSTFATTGYYWSALGQMSTLGSFPLSQIGAENSSHYQITGNIASGNNVNGVNGVVRARANSSYSRTEWAIDFFNSTNHSERHNGAGLCTTSNTGATGGWRFLFTGGEAIISGGTIRQYGLAKV